MCKQVSLNGAGVEVDKGTFNMHGGEISGNEVSSMGGAVSSLDTFKYVAVAVLPAILHNISVAVYLCIRGHLI